MEEFTKELKNSSNAKTQFFYKQKEFFFIRIHRFDWKQFEKFGEQNN